MQSAKSKMQSEKNLEQSGGTDCKMVTAVASRRRGPQSADAST
jgi:hypothetical protein